MKSSWTWVRSGGRSNEELLREGLAIRLSTLDEGSLEVAEARSALGECLLRLSRFEEAEALLTKRLEIYRELRGESAPEAARLADQLATLTHPR